nr:hypothetical protein [Tanacetum cinerariifolium]
MVDFIVASPLRIETTEEGTKILATVDGILRIVTESSLKRNLKLQDEEGISSLPDTELFENLTLMGYNISPNQKFTFQKGQFSHQWKYLIHTIMQCMSPKSTGFNELSRNIATALVCLATNRTYNFSKMIFDGLVKNVNNKASKFLMYPRFLTMCLRMSQFGQITHTHTYDVPFHTRKLFTTLRVNNPRFFGRIVPLFDTMLVQQGEASGTPTEPHHTPSLEAQSPSHTTHSSSTLPPVTTTFIPTVTPSDSTSIRQYTRRARIAQSSALPPIRTGQPLLSPPPCLMIQHQGLLSLLLMRAAQEVEINRLKERVKLLEDREGVDVERFGDDALIKGRSLDEGEAAAERVSNDSEEMATILTSIDAATILVGRITDVPTGSRSIPTASPPADEVPTGSDVVPTASPVFATAIVVTPYRRRKGKEVMTEAMRLFLTFIDAGTVLAGGIANVPTGSRSIPTASPPADEVPTSSDVVPTASLVFATTTVVTPYRRIKGKEVMVESDTPKKQKVQEQIDAQIARDAEVARIHVEEELQSMIDGLDRNNETVAKYLQEYQQFALELPLKRRIDLISDLVRYQDNYAKVHKFQSQQRKPWTKKQKRDYYMAMIRSNLGWKVKDFRGMTFEEVEANFNSVWKHIEDFIPMGSKEEAERFKRKGISFEQKSAKKQKTSEAVPKEVKSPDEVLEEKVKEMMQLVPIEEVYVEALQVKHPIIDWKTYHEG